MNFKLVGFYQANSFLFTPSVHKMGNFEVFFCTKSFFLAQRAIVAYGLAYIFWKLLFQRIIWHIWGPATCILWPVRFFVRFWESTCSISWNLAIGHWGMRNYLRFLQGCNGFIGFMKLKNLELIMKVYFRCRHDTFRILLMPFIKKLSPSQRVMKENPTKRPNIPPKSATKTNSQNCNLQVIDKRSPLMKQDPCILAFPVLVVGCTLSDCVFPQINMQM